MSPDQTRPDQPPTHAEVLAILARNDVLTRRVAALEAQSGRPAAPPNRGLWRAVGWAALLLGGVLLMFGLQPKTREALPFAITTLIVASALLRRF
jgi:hypothetical protein